jgi:L-lactate dehydrogenase complex protein LldE
MSAVQLFVTCLTDTFFPETGEAIVRVLNRLGQRVEFPQAQTCCGQPNFNAGMRADARRMAEHTIRTFENTEGPIVTPSGSCAGTIRHSYPELFADSPAWLGRAQSLAARTFEFSEYLVDVLGVVDVGAHWNGRLTYHPSCHLLRALNIDRQPRLLLSHIRGAEIVDLPNAEECCGFGGVFSIAHPELSAEFLKRKIASLEASGSSTLVLCETGCLMNIAGGLKRMGKPQRVIHLAEALDHV